jgi:CBS domain containing-hemolysin-like protein
VTPDTLFWVALGGLATVSLASLGARSLRDFSRHDLEAICARRNVPQWFTQILRQHEQVTLGVEHLVALATTVTIAAGSLYIAANWDAWRNQGVAKPLTIAAGAMLLALIVGVWLPRAIARLWAATFVFYTWGIWSLVGQILTPLQWGGRLFDGVLHRLAGRSPTPPDEESLEEEIRSIVIEGHREGLLEGEARDMIERVIRLHDADVAEVMTPRTDVHMIDVSMPWDEMLQHVIAVGHTRIPVFRENRDEVIGILHSKDLLPELAKPSQQPRRDFSEILRKPYFVPETKAVDDLLAEFQKTRSHIAVVLDEYGGVAGLVTIEDVLEEIVGEIIDEYDEDLVEEIQKIDDHTYEALGRAHVDEVNATMGLDLPEDDDFDTIGGFVFSQLGRIPVPSESVLWHDKVRITVLDMSRRRIERVRLELLDQKARETA